ncbi:hypothetical protein T484DRAFT_1804430 [Baffinella frigidus]|nr:hypothetical protein T484DRAFT_1804430 [Cryptophyta sp. CCMP2293]
MKVVLSAAGASFQRMALTTQLGLLLLALSCTPAASLGHGEAPRLSDGLGGREALSQQGNAGLGPAAGSYGLNRDD